MAVRVNCSRAPELWKLGVMHNPLLLADAAELMKVMSVVAVTGVCGVVCLLGALINFLSKDMADRKVAWMLLGVGALCAIPALYLFVLPEITHILHRQ